MKTLELKLKKYVLIVEIPRLADYEFINKECKYLKIGNEEIKLNASTLDKFEFLCKGSELTEEIAIELVEEHYMSGVRSYEIYNDYKYNDSRWLDDAKESLISAVESKEKFWLENPVQNTKPTDDISFYDSLEQKELAIKKWQEAEEKTFKNPLIFVKK